MQSIVEITSIGGRAYLVEGEERAVLVDTLSPGNYVWLMRRLKKRGIDPGKISLIVLTHGHIDHFGNALRMREETGAPIAIHELDVEGPSRGRNMRLHSRNLYEKGLAYFSRRIWTRSFEPDILLSGDEGDFSDYGIAARWIRTPGHTPGSICVVLPGDAAIVGDLVIGRFGLLKRPAYPLWVSDDRELKDSVRRLLEYSPTTLFTGHGGPLDPEEVRRVFVKDRPLPG